MSRPDRAVIPVAGLATRMHPLSRVIPKELLPLGRRPVLHHVVEELVRGGVRKFQMVISEKTQAIERYFTADDLLDETLHRAGLAAGWTAGDEHLSRTSFEFVRQDVPRGIADAIHKAYTFVDGEPFFLHMGDSVLTGDPDLYERMIEAWERFGATCVVAVRRMPKTGICPTATIVPSGGLDDAAFPLERIIEKPEEHEMVAPAAVIGRYLISAPMLAAPRSGDLHSSPFGGIGAVFPDRDALAGPTIAVWCRPEATVHDAGTLDGYLRAQAFFALEDKAVGEDVRDMTRRVDA